MVNTATFLYNNTIFINDSLNFKTMNIHQHKLDVHVYNNLIFLEIQHIHVIPQIS